MATKQTKCDDCEKKDCPQRVLGAACSHNLELSPLIAAVKSRDPVLLSRFIVSVIESEHGRYQKAKDMEDIGGTIEKTIMQKDGTEYTVTETKSIDNNISTLAMNIMKAGKMVNEMLNPPKAVPFNQTNIQNNFGTAAADEIRGMTGMEKEKALKFIDEKLDVKRES